MTARPIWPEGCKLQVAANLQAERTDRRIPDQWPRDPQGIAELLERMDQIEPFEMTPEEEADWLAWRGKIKDYELANFERRIEDSLNESLLTRYRDRG